MKKFILSLVVACATTFTFAQKFEGTIIMGIEYDNLPPEYEAYESMLPKENVLKVKGNKSRVEIPSMGGEQIVIMDSDKKEGVMLMNLMGQKIAMKMGPEDFKATEEAAKEDKSKTEITNETKKIAGYKCTKAIVTDEEGEEVEIWFTKEIPTVASENNKLKGSIDGFPMQYSMERQGMSMIVTVTKVDKGTISDTEFETPEGYQEMSQEDLKGMFGGMGGE